MRECHVDPERFVMAQAGGDGRNKLYMDGVDMCIVIDDASFEKVVRWLGGRGEIFDVNACAPHAGAGL